MKRLLYVKCYSDYLLSTSRLVSSKSMIRGKKCTNSCANAPSIPEKEVWERSMNTSCRNQCLSQQVKILKM